jgi:hypothetical protein
MVEKKWVLCDKATADQVRREHVDTVGILRTALCPVDWTDERLVAEEEANLANPNRVRKLSKRERVRREVVANMDPEVLANTNRNKNIIVADKEDQTPKKKTHQKKVRCKLTGLSDRQLATSQVSMLITLCNIGADCLVAAEPEPPS